MGGPTPFIFPSESYLVAWKEKKVARGAKLTDRMATHRDGEGNIASEAAQGDHSLLLANAVSLSAVPESPLWCVRKRISVFNLRDNETCVVVKFHVILNKLLLFLQIKELRALIL